MNVLRLVSVLMVSMALLACANKGKQDSNTRQSELALASELFAQTVKQQEKVKSPDEPGMIRIERHTAGYTISMVMDATDDNVFFVMDLPEEEKKKQEEAEKEAEAEQDNGESKADKPNDAGKKEPESKEESSSSMRAETEAGKHVVYAQTYFFEKKYGRALAEVNRAIEYSPDSAIAHSLKGSILFKRGDQTKARESWEKAVELDPGMEDVKQMLEKVKK